MQKGETGIFGSKFFFRLFLFGIALGSIPAVIIGLISYSIASNDIQTKVKEGNLQILQQTEMRVEQLLHTLEMTSVQYVHSSLVRDALSRSLSSADFRMIGDLSRGLYSLHAFAGIRNAYLVSPEKDWVISNDGFSDLRSFDKREMFSRYGEQPLNIFWKTNDETIDLVLKMPLTLSSTRPHGLLVAEVEKSELENMLTRHRHIGQLYVLDPNLNDFLAASGGPVPASVREGLQQHLDSTGKRQHYFSANIDGKRAAVSYFVSPYNDWVYVSVANISEITKETRKIALITFFVGITLLVGTSILAFYGSSRIYSPIRRLFESTNQWSKDTEDSQNKDEFELIEQRFHRVFSQSKQLQHQIRGQITQLQEFLIMKLIMGQISESEFKHKGSAYQFPQNWSWLCVLTLQIDTMQGTRYRESDKELLLFAVNNIVGELIPKRNRFTPVVMDESQVTLALVNDMSEEAAMNAFHKMAETIQANVQEYLQLKVSIGISRMFTDIDDAKRAFGECLETLKRRISLGPGIILRYDDSRLDAGVESSALYARLKVLEEQLIHAARAGDRNSAETLFDEYVSVISEREIVYADVQMMMLRLIASLTHIVQEYGSPVRQTLGEEGAIERFMKLHTLDDISEWIRQRVLRPVCDTVNERLESQYMSIANRLVRYIHENFNRDISLDSLASELNFHPVYLSRVFKKETGVNFSEYLTEYRMKKAKEWLETTNMKVAEIAEELNYTNPTAFIRTFRKQYGMTPGQYRSQNANLDA